MEVKFKQNLVNLRQAKNLSQEQLASELGISRQSVSKWESGDAYPEMKMLLNLCDFFKVDLGVLVHNNIDNAQDSALCKKYDQTVTRHAKFTALGVGLILLGVSCMLFFMSLFGGGATAAGVAVLILFIAIAVAMFITSNQPLERFKKSHPSLPLNFYKEQEVEIKTSKHQKGIALGIGIILAGVSVLLVSISFLEDIIAVGTLMCFLAIGVPVLIYNDIQKDKYNLEKYNLENSEEYLSVERKDSAISGVIMMFATIIFLLLGFLADLWHIAWVVYPVCGILCGIVSIIAHKGK